MKKYSFWLMNAKLNLTFFGVFAGFFTLIGFVIADNRFELETPVYIALIILWMIVLMQVLMIIIIKNYRDKNIPLIIRILIVMTIVSVVAIYVFNIAHVRSDFDYPYYEDRKDTTS